MDRTGSSIRTSVSIISSNQRSSQSVSRITAATQSCFKCVSLFSAILGWCLRLLFSLCSPWSRGSHEFNTRPPSTGLMRQGFILYCGIGLDLKFEPISSTGMSSISVGRSGIGTCAYIYQNWQGCVRTARAADSRMWWRAMKIFSSKNSIKPEYWVLTHDLNASFRVTWFELSSTTVIGHWNGSDLPKSGEWIKEDFIQFFSFQAKQNRFVISVRAFRNKDKTEPWLFAELATEARTRTLPVCMDVHYTWTCMYA